MHSEPDIFGPVRARRRSVSLTPLIDVVFLLLIFFMLANTFLQTQTLTVVTPPSALSRNDSDRTVVEVRVMASGRFSVDDTFVAADRLQDSIGKIVSGDDEAVVSILAEKDVRVQPLIVAVEAARAAGVKTVATTRLGDGR